jgi:hypothetical protein
LKPENESIDFESIKKDARKMYASISKKRFKKVNSGYCFDRWLFQLAMFSVFFYLWFVAQSYNYNLDYFKCESGFQEYGGIDEGCKNPFYDSANFWKNVEVLPVGEYGQKPGHLFWSIEYVPILIFGFAFGMNHLFHNRKKVKA